MGSTSMEWHYTVSVIILRKFAGLIYTFPKYIFNRVVFIVWRFIEGCKLIIEVLLKYIRNNFFIPLSSNYKNTFKKGYSVWDHFIYKIKVIKYRNILLPLPGICVFDLQLVCIKWLEGSFYNVSSHVQLCGGGSFNFELAGYTEE